MKKVRRNWPAAVAHRIGMGGAVDFTATRIGQTLHIPCGRGHIVDFEISGNMPPDFVAKKMMQKGWTIGSKLICPKHSRKAKTEPEPEKKEEPMVTPAPAEPVKPAASPAAGKAKRLVYMALEDHYDENAKRYREGHSDATIAKACNISENAVKLIREESYGPLGEPIDVAEFRAALAAFGGEIDASAAAARQGLARLTTRLDNLVRKNGWAE